MLTDDISATGAPAVIGLLHGLQVAGSGKAFVSTAWKNAERFHI
jgi:hypothetical protein